ncbi:hypothetical protein BDV38DRAFT_287394 [Aspergillus pseudotamarii]|uniref:Invertebrate defensins family profile domain-containing protein n=1 Tax=Aspergillus pseudotamarii TaxID=132259 RepID=A0A5N6SGD6_ASPPS|nr:uncharacterized protein BDV38DRAFT_287394 [Aspergillus pseudotamarii]KAE8132800.1 hypothetical protein BDV38DRAFT_287394 [Aspergillus pseudotamarii]
MKVALLLAACATLAAAAATESTTSFAATENLSFPQDVFISSSSESSAVQACGGLTPAQCRNLCGRLGFRCFRCTSSACECSNNC